MRHQNNTKKGDTKQSFNIETRNKLEGLVDEYQKSIRNHDIRGGFLPSLGRKFLVKIHQPSGVN